MGVDNDPTVPQQAAVTGRDGSGPGGASEVHPTDAPAPGPTEVGGSDVRDRAGDPAMTRSEERLRARTESQPVERVRLRKYVVTEYQQVTVDVRREELRLEHVPPGTDDPATDVPTTDGPATDTAGAGPGVPATGAGAAPLGDGPSGAGTSDEHVIVLHEERPVVRTETVPVERVRLRKETVTGHETVGGEVRREEIEVDADPDAR